MLKRILQLTEYSECGIVEPEFVPTTSVSVSAGDRNIPQVSLSGPPLFTTGQVPRVLSLNAAKALKPVGMINLGNDCFANATLQVLLRMEPFATLIRSIRYYGCRTNGLINHLSSVIDTMEAGRLVDNCTMMENIGRIHSDFRRGAQQDAHEFFIYLVEYLQKVLVYVDGINSCWGASHLSKALEGILFSKFTQIVRCGRCQNASVTTMSEPFMMVQCRSSIEESIRHYFRVEKLDEDCYHCEKCMQKVSATKRLALNNSGAFLCIQLLRFYNNFAGFSGKRGGHVSFPLSLDLTPFSADAGGARKLYRLHSMVIHEGQSCNSGHYTAVVNAYGGEFWEFDDTQVLKLSWPKVKLLRPYLLFYQKVDAEPIAYPSSPNKGRATGESSPKKMKLD